MDSILRVPQTLEMMGPFNAICPLIAVFVAFLPSFLYAFLRGPRKVAFFLGAWYLAVSRLARFPLVADAEIFEAPVDMSGFLLFAATPFVGILLFYFGLYRTDTDVRAFMHSWPVSWTCAQQLYRLGGACFAYLYLNQEGYDSYFNLQTGVLDIFMGITAVPMSIYIHIHRSQKGFSCSGIPSGFTIWHSPFLQPQRTTLASIHSSIHWGILVSLRSH